MKVSWDDDIWKVIKAMFQTTNQNIYIYNIDILVGGFNITEKSTVKGDRIIPGYPRQDKKSKICQTTNQKHSPLVDINVILLR